MGSGIGGESPASAWPGDAARFGNAAPKFDPNASFKFDPKVFTPSWHRGLSETFCDYGMVNIVGEGRNSAVFIVQHKRTQSFFACKMLTKADHEADILRTEIEMMRQLDHPNVVRLYETNEDRDSLFLLMEYCAGGDLFSYISESELGRLEETTARCFAEQMCSALAYCHSSGVVHRDVKPENFLLETEDPGCRTLKLADFGIATSIRRERPTRAGLFEGSFPLGLNSFAGSFPLPSGLNSFTGSFPNSLSTGGGLGSFAGSAMDMSADDLAGQDQSQQSEMLGSLPYMAPEMLSNAWKKLVDDAKKVPADELRMLSAGDMWSTGVVTYVMLSGALPFGTDIEGICSGELPDFAAECWSDISEDAVDFIKKLLQPRAEDRLMAREALTDEWVRGQPRKSQEGVQVRDMLPRGFLDPARAPWSGTQSFPESRQELAKKLIESLKEWRTLPKLKRLAIAAVAKRLEPRHPTSWLAQHSYHVFNDTASNLKCERMANALCGALGSTEKPKVASFVAASCTSMADAGSVRDSSATVDSFFRAEGTQRIGSSFASLGSSGSVGSGQRSFFGRGSSAKFDGRSVTGLHVRQRLKIGFQRLARVKEEQGGSPGSPGRGSSGRGSGFLLSASPKRFNSEANSIASPGRSSTASSTGGVEVSQHGLDLEDLLSVPEMRHLVDALDGMKNGYVDYTLLVAALLPPEVYSEQERIVEVFQLFDLEGQGKISSDNLRRTMNSPDADTSRYAAMVREFDLDGDGRLNLEEFALMVRGPSFESSPLLDSSARLPDSVTIASGERESNR